MKLKEFKFNEIPFNMISIFDGDICIAEGFIGEVLNTLVEDYRGIEEREIKSTNTFFNSLVIRL